MTSCPEFSLTLVDGTCLRLSAADETAATTLTFLAQAARLPVIVAPSGPSRRLRVITADLDGKIEQRAVNARDIVCVLEAPNAPQFHPRRPLAADATPEQRLWRQLMRLSSTIARETQTRGSFLVHSALALAPIPGPLGPAAGVLLAGRSGVGKSTASRRLRPPWQALADDVTLIVRDPSGGYWAHPWPTWSRFFGEERGDGSDSWDVQSAVPLRAIFVLEQAASDSVEPLGPGHAAALLAELARQTSVGYLRNIPLDELGAFNRQRFENVCALAKALPAYQLNVSLHGCFWEEIGRVLATIQE